jgi:hypothetical protein
MSIPVSNVKLYLNPKIPLQNIVPKNADLLGGDKISKVCLDGDSRGRCTGEKPYKLLRVG